MGRENPPRYITRAEAERLAGAAGLGPGIVQAACRSGRLPAYRVSVNRYAINREDFDRWLDAPGVPAAEQDERGYRCRLG